MNEQATAVKPAQIPSMDSIKKEHFASTELDQAQAKIQSVLEIVNANDGITVFNFDPEKELFPEGYGLVIQPINERGKNAKGESVTICVGVGIGAIPEFQTIEATKNGADWIREQVQNNLTAKFANAIRRREGDEVLGAVPFEVDDFITSQRAEGVLVAFRQLAGDYIKVLKERGLKLINEQLLRQTLQSTAFAEQHFPQIKQDIWVKILDSMIANANKQGMAPGMLTEWKSTRDSAGLPEIKSISAEDFDF